MTGRICLLTDEGHSELTAYNYIDKDINLNDQTTQCITIQIEIIINYIILTGISSAELSNPTKTF